MMGYLATAKGAVDANIRRAMVYGSVNGVVLLRKVLA